MSTTTRKPPHVRFRRPRGVGLLLGLCAVAVPLAVGSGTVPSGVAHSTEQATAPDAGPAPIDFAIVVDQSASLGTQDLEREANAAALIAQAELSARSRATVIGFGSEEQPGQSAVREVCPPTVLNVTGRDRISRCARELARPDRREVGPGTDFPNALRQALDRLPTDGGTDAGGDDRPAIIFLLTDGKLDVSDSPSYGDPPESRQQVGRTQLAQVLADARQRQVQIWPLGFGSDIDRATLRDMAAGGYGKRCADLPDATPRMRVVGDSGALQVELQQTFAWARCAQFEEGNSGTPPTDLEVTIPPIATDGSINVAKQDPGVAVTYYDPDGGEVPLQGTQDGSTFEVSGQHGAVEALRVTDPKPGTWRVHLEPAGDGPPREATVSAIWQGRLRSSLTLTPPSPRPGERATVEVRLQTRDGVVIDDPEQLADMHGSARLAGDGFEPVDLALRDNGLGPDARAGDVRFTGEVTVPEEATGDLEVTSELAAPGVTADQRPYHTVVSDGPPVVEVSMSLPSAKAHPGDSVEGTLNVTNNDTRAHALRLVLEDPPPGGAVRLRPAAVRAAPGETTTSPLTVSFGAEASLGTVGGRIAVLDTDDDNRRVLAGRELGVTLTAPPTWWDRHRWTVLGGVALALLLATAAVVNVLADRRRRNPSGLVVELRRNGQRLDHQQIRSAKGQVYRFLVEQGPGRAPGLRTARPGTGNAYELRRDPSGSVTLRVPKGARRTLRLGEPLALDDELELVVKDPSGRAPRRPRGEPPGSPRTAGPSRPTGSSPSGSSRPTRTDDQYF